MEANRDNLLADSRRREYLNYGVRLYTAALTGDWAAARRIHRNHPACFTERITKLGDTALHIAAVSQKTNFVLELVPIMAASNSLALTNNIGNTALCLAAASGLVTIAKAMVDENDNLPRIRGNGGLTPLHMAALLGHRDMVNYLLDCRPELSEEEWGSLFISLINTDLYDVALEIIRRHRNYINNLAFAREDHTRETPLHILSKKSQNSFHIPQGRPQSRCFNIFSGNEEKKLQTELIKIIWEKVLEEPQDHIAELMTDPWRILFVAVEVGNIEFVTTIIRCYPDLIWKLDEKHRSIFHVAVQFRQETIFRLIFEMGAIKDLLATYTDPVTYDNMLHLAAMLPSSDRLNCISGAALQMQREMLWFKVVENIVQPQLVEAKNAAGKTPNTLFTEQHKELRKEGEEWMRKTAGSCSVVATLIAGVAFGAALKVPGSQGVWNWIFAISDSLSLISATASILMFLSIMTSRYAEKDFLKSLPQKLMIGLTLLFISIATMMIAFTATFHLLFNLGYLWIVTSVLSCIPIVLFALQEFPLLLEVSRSTIGCNFIFKPRHQLFSSNS